ncbi:hypothetical protein RJ640_003465 [Escallonia rubra]|uniref:Pentatricopeptide repeat-containing protein n=1 Tax=Escallonia rubra TaxID=112253 RepID=A0AA88QRC4_9ASTE|nr:hypothetical protein RJ640_003465 [Escallonia rubra]
MFNGMSERNLITWFAMISGYNQGGKPIMAAKLLSQIQVEPNEYIFASAISACASLLASRLGEQIHAWAVKLGYSSNSFVSNSLVSMYMKCGQSREALTTFSGTAEPNSVSYNALIMGIMAKEISVMPDDFTYTSVLAVCAGLASIPHGKQIHSHLIRTRLDKDVTVCNALVNMKAVEIFEQMKERGINPDSVTFIRLISACNHAWLVDKGQEYFNSMVDIYVIAPDVEHFSCLIDLLGRAGRLKEAEEYRDKFPSGHDSIILGCLLSACRLHGDIITRLI